MFFCRRWIANRYWSACSLQTTFYHPNTNFSTSKSESNLSATKSNTRLHLNHEPNIFIKSFNKPEQESLRVACSILIKSSITWLTLPFQEVTNLHFRLCCVKLNALCVWNERIRYGMRFGAKLDIARVLLQNGGQFYGFNLFKWYCLMHTVHSYAYVGLELSRSWLCCIFVYQIRIASLVRHLNL